MLTYQIMVRINSHHLCTVLFRVKCSSPKIPAYPSATVSEKMSWRLVGFFAFSCSTLNSCSCRLIPLHLIMSDNPDHRQIRHTLCLVRFRTWWRMMPWPEALAQHGNHQRLPNEIAGA